MKKITSRILARVVLPFASLFLALFMQPQAARSQYDSVHVGCGLDSAVLASNMIDPATGVVFGAPLPIGAGIWHGSTFMEDCNDGAFTGVFQFYYEDCRLNTNDGFDDPTLVFSTAFGGLIPLGEARRYTVCQVARYIQTVFDFSAHIPVGGAGRIRIFVRRSQTAANPAPLGTTFLAFASPTLGVVTTGINSGFLHDFAVNGIDRDATGAGYHATMTVNFDHIKPISDTHIPILYNDDVSNLPDNCRFDLFSVVLHELTHAMGWMSFIHFPASVPGGLRCDCVYNVEPRIGGVPASMLGINLFTHLDWAMHCGTVTPTAGPGVKVVVGTMATPVLNTSAIANFNYWTNNQSAPNNFPVYSGGGTSTGSYCHHLDNQRFSYTFRERVSPGDRQEFVMASSSYHGLLRRAYTKGEIQTLVNVLGYSLTPTFTAANPDIIPNHVPYSRKMALMPIDRFNYAEYTEAPSIADYTIPNNTIPSFFDIDLSHATFTVGDLVDADGDPITIDAATIVNFRGCGIAGNNHNALTVISPTVIRYTPQPNFYGRAQFGFNVTDGRERGSFRVVTIDVTRGTNVSYVPGANMVYNGDFEQGVETRTTSSAPEWAIINAQLEGNFSKESKWQSVNFSDGHPFGFRSFRNSQNLHFGNSGVVVRDNIMMCGISSLLGIPNYSYPNAHNPNSVGGAGNRYQIWGEHSLQKESYYNLFADVVNCHKYIIEFDLYKNSTSVATMEIRFADHINTTLPVFNFSVTPVSLTHTGGVWQHITTSFWYCGATPSSILYLRALSGNVFHIDNIVVREDLAPPAMTATISATGIGGCQTSLSATFTNTSCSPLLYSWIGPGLSCTTCASPIATPAAAASYTLTVTDGCGRTATATTTINPYPAAIGVPGDVCAGTSMALTNATAGGTWSGGAVGIATIGSTTGIVTGLAGGTATVSYRISTGCFVTATVTVLPFLPAITGTLAICEGTLTTLGNSAVGGTWSSSNTTVATVDVSAGVVTAVSVGTTTISYTMPSGCFTTTSLSVNPILPPLTGIDEVCTGLTVTLSNTVSGGTWSSSSIAVATVGSSTGIVTGVSPGIADITYTVGGCPAVLTVTVHLQPAAITGATSLCEGALTTLVNSTVGGTWSSSNTSVATVDMSAGVVTAISIGTATISYSMPSGCFVTGSLSVLAMPAPISGVDEVCRGLTTALTNSVPGGTWSSSATGVATVGSSTGVVTGVSAGITTITYAIGPCFSLLTVTVHPLPAAITGATSLCEGVLSPLANSTVGGTWSSSDMTLAAIDPATGLVTALSAGTLTLSYTMPTGCFTTVGFTVLPMPAPISGIDEVCPGLTTALTNSVLGGTWSSSATGVATVGSSTGMVTGVSAGTTTITYAIGPCFSLLTVTVHALPAAITGTSTICEGTTSLLANATLGGTWSSSDWAIATIDAATGLAHGVAAGTATISYHIPTGCYATTVVTILSMPAISGPHEVCRVQSVALTHPFPGGTWTRSTGHISVGSSSGVVTGIVVGTSAVTYTEPGGCTAIHTMTVLPSPVAITGVTYACLGATRTLSDATPGGSWSSSDAAIASVDPATGIVAGLAGGTASITYTLPNGCYGPAVVTFTVIAVPPIAGLADMCAWGTSGTITVTNPMAGGGWSSTLVAISSIGVVSSYVSAGVGYITYTMPTGCATTASLTVHPLPAPITGTTLYCIGTTGTLSSSTAGGYWVSGSGSIATIGSSTGIVSAVAVGASAITYITPAGCSTTTTVHVISTTTPIVGGSGLCAGATITLASWPPGGVWASSATGIAVIGSSSGIVAGIAPGTSTISYHWPTSGSTCSNSTTITVETLLPISGLNTVCPGSTTALTHPTSGGVWSSSTTAVATVDPATGVVTGVLGGTTTITYSLSGCHSFYDITVSGGAGACAPCTLFASAGSFTRLGASGTLAGPLSLPPGNYYIGNNVTVTGPVAITGGVVYMAPGTRISVAATAALTLSGCHLFCCPGNMWNGIELLSTTVQTGTLVLEGDAGGQSTLLEDATTGVEIVGAQIPTGGAPHILTCNNALFNRNNTAINIEDYQPATPLVYPFQVQNTTITCRDLSGGATYPYTWPGNYGSGGLKNLITAPSPYHSPYNINNYSVTACYNGLPASVGIRLYKVGHTAGGTYAGITIGEPVAFPMLAGPHPEWNLYDALGYGIYAWNTNLTVHNNVFQNSRTVITGSGPLPPSSFIDQVGIYTHMDNGAQYRLVAEPVVSGTGMFATEVTNRFYDLRIGVYSKDYYHIRCEKTDMRSTQVRATNGDSRYGYMMQSTAYDDVKVNNNNITNIANGVSFVSTYGGGYWVHLGGDEWVYSLATQALGNIEINYNTIKAALGAATPTTQYQSFAIAVQNTLPGGSSTLPIGTVSTNHNIIRDAPRGIMVQGYQTQPAYTGNNNITVVARPRLTGTMSTEKCWGINHTSNWNGAVFENTVTGVMASPNDVYNDSVRAYYAEANNSLHIVCNVAEFTGRGFEFYSANPATRWKDNSMEQHGKGLVLNHAHMGPQGGTGTPFSHVWLNPWWWSVGAFTPQTYVIATPTAVASPLYFASAAVVPTENDGFTPFNAYSAGGSTPSLIVTSGFTMADCLPEPPVLMMAFRRSAYEPGVLDGIYYGAYADARKWIDGYLTWQAVGRDSSLDTSAALHQFATMAAGSRMAYLSGLEQLLEAGDISGAAAALAITPTPLGHAIDTATGVEVMDDTTVDYIINTQKDFYGIYLHYLQQAMDSTDSAQVPYIAQLCPLQYGPVVYRARALYTTIWNDLRVWCEGCEDEEEGPQQRPIRPGSTQQERQQYTLHPNPNDGHMALTQLMADEQPVAMEVTDIMGRSVQKATLVFANKRAGVELENVSPGIYAMKLMDGKGRIFTFKFIVK